MSLIHCIDAEDLSVMTGAGSKLKVMDDLRHELTPSDRFTHDIPGNAIDREVSPEEDALQEALGADPVNHGCNYSRPLMELEAQRLRNLNKDNPGSEDNIYNPTKPQFVELYGVRFSLN